MDILADTKEYLNNQLGKHGQVGGHTYLEDYVNSLTPYELVMLIETALEEKFK